VRIADAFAVPGVRAGWREHAAAGTAGIIGRAVRHVRRASPCRAGAPRATRWAEADGGVAARRGRLEGRSAQRARLTRTGRSGTGGTGRAGSDISGGGISVEMVSGGAGLTARAAVGGSAAGGQAGGPPAERGEGGKLTAPAASWEVAVGSNGLDRPRSQGRRRWPQRARCKAIAVVRARERPRQARWSWADRADRGG